MVSVSGSGSEDRFQARGRVFSVCEIFLDDRVDTAGSGTFGQFSRRSAYSGRKV